jgi:hypothetical protein
VAQAILGDYIAGTAGVGRIRRLGHLSSRYGTPPSRGRRHQPGGERLWIAGDLYAAVELANRGTGSPLQLVEGPAETAEIWASMTGRKIIVKPSSDDGAPTLQFA